MEIIVNNFSGARMDSSFIRKLAKRISRKNFIVSLSFVPRNKMKNFNKIYRKINKPTDVLSFSMREGRLLGDVVICPQVARENAKSFGSTFKEEIARLVVHGILHLLGMDHGKKMFDLQDKIVRSEINA